jgi:hypothetical protein
VCFIYHFLVIGIMSGNGSSTPTLTDVLNAIISAIANTLNAIAEAISANATVIGTVVVIGAVLVGLARLPLVRGLIGRFFGAFS